MADFASTIAENILGTLGYLVPEELRLVLDIKSKLTDLQGTMTTIKAVLLDAEEKQASNRALSIWLRLLKDIFYDAEDVLDGVECKVLRKQLVRTHGCSSKEVCDYFPCCNALAFRFQLGHKIKNIRERLDNLVAQKDKFNLVERVEDRHVMYVRRDMTHSFVRPSEVIGRENDKKKIIDLLLHPDYSRNVNVIPVVGIGGLGKTTIAKLAYDDKLVAKHFELRMWVCVSKDFDVTRLIREILAESGVRIDEKSTTLNELQTKLIEKLKNKRYLLVLDDVWNEDLNKWTEFRDLLFGGSKGSTILVTTRGHKVASIMGTVSAHDLKGLSEKDCLSLFVKYAFKEGEDKKYPNLLKIGKEIVEKCKEVPLAIKTLGGLLFSKVDEREWKFVRDNGIWKLEQKEGDILPALKLSYDQMPSHLKQCFAFCSLFSKDHEFDSKQIIAFWMAHGLLNNSQNIALEDVGDMYIKELLSKSFFHDVTNFSWCYRFKMHDLVHDLALKVAQEECSIVDTHTQDIAGTVRHLSFSHNCRQVPNNFYKSNRGVRTTLFQTKQQVPALVEACILRFKCLRALDLSYSSFEVLSNSIGTLKHLRYLNLAGNVNIKKLPHSICKLYNLQTLLLHGSSNLERLPKDSMKMINLRHLTVTTTYTCLFENGECCLNSLRFLHVSHCPRLKVLFRGMDGICPTNLTTLETLVIDNCQELSLTGGEGNQDLKLSLRYLEIEELPKLEVLPQWLQKSANTLQFLRISCCRNLMGLPEWLPSLKSLRTLEIFNCSKFFTLGKRMDHLTAHIPRFRLAQTEEVAASMA